MPEDPEVDLDVDSMDKEFEEELGTSEDGEDDFPDEPTESEEKK